ncbi:Kelch repeat and BTB domain-containing protein 13 [Nibea albiflora]|uniref:Kelch repeat and BTB domain-containing protein 13 n=1 Tax=Nibea albiflora TaxID=240163 RepID=A0ACB7EG93_NIBAL|nr:Kelch repeat and BTB domain-containing protein 13 [Nibea albiflora]
MESSNCLHLSQQPRNCKPPQSLRINIDHRSFIVEKNLLTENCEYFRALFQSGMRECQQEEIHLQCVGVLGFLVMLQVLDGEQPMVNSDQIVEAIECAAFLQVPALTKHLINIVNSENCLLMYHTASTYGVWELSHSSALFIKDMYNELKEEICTLPDKLIEYIESLLPSCYMAVCSHSPSTELLQDLQRTVCYLDEDNGDWKVLTHLPLSTSTTMAGVAVLENKLYIIGGVHNIRKNVVETGFCYNPTTNTWSTICGPKLPRYNFTLIGHEGCLYAIGGEYNMKVMSSVERYMVSNQSWNFVSPLPCSAASVVSTIAMHRVFICLWKDRGTTEIHKYVPEQNQWLLVTTLIRQHSYALYMVAHKDNLYVIRNGPCDDFLMCVIDCYNLSSGQWTAMWGQYGNNKGCLFTGVVRGDSVFTLSQQVTTEYTVEDYAWRVRREMKGVGRIGSIYTFLMRLPKASMSLVGHSLDWTQDQIHRDIPAYPRLSPQCSDNL